MSRGARRVLAAVVTMPGSSRARVLPMSWPLVARRATMADGAATGSATAQPGRPARASRVCLPTSARRAQIRLRARRQVLGDGGAQADPGRHVRLGRVQQPERAAVRGADALLQFGGDDAEPVPPGPGHPEHAHAARAGEPLAAGGVDRVGAARGVHVPEGLGGVHPERHARRAAQRRRLGHRLDQAAVRGDLDQVDGGGRSGRPASAPARPGRRSRRRAPRSR